MDRPTRRLRRSSPTSSSSDAPLTATWAGAVTIINTRHTNAGLPAYGGDYSPPACRRAGATRLSARLVASFTIP
ncbi:MAG TPA: hypothetical protein VFB61_09485 [Gemmatimonadales bacterium]|nr:hypothetical protein [Gemmatimonadales bacterium]